MAIQLESFLGGIRENGLNTQEAVSFGSTLSVTGASTFSSSVNGLKKIVNVNSANGTSPTLTAAQSGSLVVLGDATGSNVRLPAPSVGLYYDFVVATRPTSGSHGIITDAATTYMYGAINAVDYGAGSTGATVAVFVSDGTSLRSLRMNGTTTGGSVGTYIRAACTSSTLWAVEGITRGTAAYTTMFKTV